MRPEFRGELKWSIRTSLRIGSHPSLRAPISEPGGICVQKSQPKSAQPLGRAQVWHGVRRIPRQLGDNTRPGFILPQAVDPRDFNHWPALSLNPGSH
jgi:hypothetical protein